MQKKFQSNITKLITHKISVDVIPSGGGFAYAFDFLTNKEKIKKTTENARKWVTDKILEVRNAQEPNPFKNMTDEEIAGEILKEIEKRRGK